MPFENAMTGRLQSAAVSGAGPPQPQGFDRAARGDVGRDQDAGDDRRLLSENSGMASASGQRLGCGCMPHCRKKNVEVARARHTAKARAGTRDSPNSWRLEALIYLWLHAKHQGWSRTGARRRLAVTRFCERYWSTACHGNELFTWAARQIAGIVRARVQPERMQTRKRGLTRVAFGSLGPLRTGRSRRSRVPFLRPGAPMSPQARAVPPALQSILQAKASRSERQL